MLNSHKNVLQSDYNQQQIKSAVDYARADRNLTIKGEREVSSVVERLDRGPDWLKIFINTAVAQRGMRSAKVG